MGTGEAAAKPDLRARLLARRARRPAAERAAAADAFCEGTLSLPEVRAARVVCCYLSMRGEPATGPLLTHLHARGTTVLLPVLLPDFDLDWAAYTPDALRAGRFGLSEPTTPRLGVSAVARADVVVCPGLAVDGAGRRLGRGGGSYDRTLARSQRKTLRVLLVYDDEVLDAVPAAAHDEPVDVAVTPTRVLRLGADRS